MYSHNSKPISIIDTIRRNTIKLYIIFVSIVALLVGIGWLIGYFTGDTVTAVLTSVSLGIVALWLNYWYSDKLVLVITGSDVPVDRQLQNIVEELSIAASIPTPKIRIRVIDNDGANSFSVGRDPQNSTIVVTTGLIKMLTREELSGVIAHEIAHIKNRDTLVATIAASITVVSMITPYIVSRMLSNNDSSTHAPGGVMLLICGIPLLVLIPFTILLLYFAVGQHREYVADAMSARLTRHPDALASALEKIGHFPASMPVIDSLCIVGAAHPPIEERIKRLRSMTAY